MSVTLSSLRVLFWFIASILNPRLVNHAFHFILFCFLSKCKRYWRCGISSQCATNQIWWIQKNLKFLIKYFCTKNVIYLFHFFVANNRMNLIVLSQNHLHANGHLNLPWFFYLCLIVYFCWQSNVVGSN